jgi:hypothetical protein
MTVRPWSPTRPFAGRPKPPQRHQLDYTIHWPELRSVDFTAAAEDNFFLRAGDATNRRTKWLFVRAVLFT